MAKRYRVIDTVTETVVAENIHTRNDARLAKKELEVKHKTSDGSYRDKPSRYYVETDIENPNGPGIYSH